MTEEITSRLAALNGLAVASSTTAAEYDRHGKNVRRIGADLGVAYVVEGSVRWSQASGGAKVRITQKLVRVADDTVVWTQQYDAALADIFGVQADIARRIAEALPVVLEARASRATAARPTADSEAYLAFLRGITKYQQGGSVPTSLAKARAELEEAVARDPRFAVAWSWLARVIGTQYATGAQRTPEAGRRRRTRQSISTRRCPKRIWRCLRCSSSATMNARCANWRSHEPACRTRRKCSG